MKRVDTRGLTCPAPLIKTRQGLNEAEPGEAIEIVVDNAASLNNISRYLKDNGLRFIVSRQEELSIITVTGSEGELNEGEERGYCTMGMDEGAPEHDTADMLGEESKHRTAGPVLQQPADCRRIVVSSGTVSMVNGDPEPGSKLINSSGSESVQ